MKDDYVVPGQKIKLTARRHNLVTDTVRDYQSRRRRMLGAALEPTRYRGPDALVRWQSEELLDVLSVVEIGDPVFDQDDEDDVGKYINIVLECRKPQGGELHKIAVTLRPASSEVVPVLTEGLCYVRCEIQSAEHHHAAPKEGETKLFSAGGNGFRILWRPAEMGEQRVLVRLGTAAGSDLIQGNAAGDIEPDTIGRIHVVQWSDNVLASPTQEERVWFPSEISNEPISAGQRVFAMHTGEPRYFSGEDIEVNYVVTNAACEGSSELSPTQPEGDCGCH